MTSKKRVVLIASSVVVTMMVVITSLTAYQQWGPERRHELATSWAFDLSDPELIAGYADAVVIGRVVANEGFTARSLPSTTFGIEVVATAKGAPEKSIKVDQYGGRSGRDVYVIEGQAPLEVGAMYVLAVTCTGAAPCTVIAGPASVTKIDPSDAGQQLATWKSHVAKNQYPADMPR